MAMMMRQQAPPKGDIRPLWKALGIEFGATDIIWQNYNPYPKITEFDRNKEFVFVEMNSDTGWFQIWRGREFFA